MTPSQRYLYKAVLRVNFIPERNYPMVFLRKTLFEYKGYSYDSFYVVSKKAFLRKSALTIFP